MDLQISKNKRAKGKYFHKSPRGLNASKSKRIASLDITKECGEGEFYNRNYIHHESIVLAACSCRMIFLTINTNLL